MRKNRLIIVLFLMVSLGLNNNAVSLETANSTLLPEMSTNISIFKGLWEVLILSKCVERNDGKTLDLVEKYVRKEEKKLSTIGVEILAVKNEKNQTEELIIDLPEEKAAIRYFNPQVSKIETVPFEGVVSIRTIIISETLHQQIIRYKTDSRDSKYNTFPLRMISTTKARDAVKSIWKTTAEKHKVDIKEDNKHPFEEVAYNTFFNNHIRKNPEAQEAPIFDQIQAPFIYVSPKAFIEIEQIRKRATPLKGEINTRLANILAINGAGIYYDNKLFGKEMSLLTISQQNKADIFEIVLVAEALKDTLKKVYIPRRWAKKPMEIDTRLTEEILIFTTLLSKTAFFSYLTPFLQENEERNKELLSLEERSPKAKQLQKQVQKLRALLEFVLDPSAEELAINRLRSLGELKFLEESIVPKKEKDLHKNVFVSILSQLFNKKELTIPDTNLIQKLIFASLTSNDKTSIAERWDKTTAWVAHKIHLNPSLSAEEICREVGIEDVQELKKINETLRKTPIIQKVWRRTSRHGKFFDTTMFLLNDLAYLTKLIENGASPREVDLHLSTSCQRNCGHCYGQGKGYEELLAKSKVLTKDQVVGMLRQLKKRGIKLVTFSGGKEPTLRKSLAEEIEQAHELGLEVQLISNGIQLNSAVREQLLKAKRVKVSLDAATPEMYSKISRLSERKGKEAFNKAVENVKELVKLKKEKQASVRVGISFVTTPENCGQIPEFLQLGKTLGVDFINISFDYLGHTGKFSEEQKNEIKNIVRRAREDINDNKYKKITITLGGYISELADKGEETPFAKLKKPKTCRAHRFKIAVAPNGDFFVCCYYVEPGYFDDDYQVGNIQKSPLETILENNKEKEYDPAQCEGCHDFDHLVNIIFEKLFDDLGNHGVNIKEQPFASLNDFSEGSKQQQIAKQKNIRKNIQYVKESKERTIIPLVQGEDPILIRIPINAVEQYRQTVGEREAKEFLSVFRKSPSMLIELYSERDSLDVADENYKEFGLDKPDIPEGFERSRENVVTLFSVDNGEEISKSMFDEKLWGFKGGVNNTILSPIRKSNNSSDFLGSLIFGLDVLQVSRRLKDIKNIDQGVRDDILSEIVQPYKNRCITSAKFDLTAQDIIDLAKGDINSMIRAVKKLIKLLPIVPLSGQEMIEINECAKEVFSSV